MIAHCIYGVDLNPMAVELCKVSLWMEALGDDKATATALRKRHKRERTGQLGMRFEVTHLLKNMDDLPPFSLPCAWER